MWMHVRAQAFNPLTGLQGLLSFVRSFLSTHVCGLQGCQGPCLGLQRNGFSIGQVHKAEGYVVILPPSFLSNAMLLLTCNPYHVWTSDWSIQQKWEKYRFPYLLKSRRNAVGHFSASAVTWHLKCLNDVHFVCQPSLTHSALCCYLVASGKWLLLYQAESTANDSE